MNKRILALSFVLVSLVGAGVLFVIQKPVDKQASTVEQSTAQKPLSISTGSRDSSAQATTARYVDYTDDSFTKTSGTKVLFFHAPWCYQCRQLDAGLKENASSIPENTTVFKVDFDSSQDLRKKYGVTFRTAFVKIDTSGNTVGKPFIAYEEPTFANIQKNIL